MWAGSCHMCSCLQEEAGEPNMATGHVSPTPSPACNCHNSPRVLPCLHSYCLTCLQRILDDCGNKDTIACPQCRSRHTVPSLGVRGFVEDTTTCGKSPRADEVVKRKIACGLCCNSVDYENSYYCNQCLQYLCVMCKDDIHTRGTRFQGHQVCSVDKVKTPQRKPELCYYHTGYSLELFCKTCQAVICLRCIPESHNGHHYQYLSNSWEEVLATLREGAAKVRKAKGQSLLRIECVEKMQESLLLQQSSLDAQIDEYYDKVLSVLKTERSNAHQKVRAITSKNEKMLSQLKGDFEIDLTMQKSCLAFVERSLEQAGNKHEAVMQLLLKSLNEQKLSNASELFKIARFGAKVITPKGEFPSLASNVSEYDEGSVIVKGICDKPCIPIRHKTDIVVTLVSVIPNVARRGWQAEISCPTTAGSKQSFTMGNPPLPINDTQLKITTPSLPFYGDYTLTVIPRNSDTFFKKSLTFTVKAV